MGAKCGRCFRRPGSVERPTNEAEITMNLDYAAIRSQISTATDEIVSTYFNSQLYEPVTYLPAQMELNLQKSTVKMFLTVLVSILLPHLHRLGRVALRCGDGA